MFVNILLWRSALIRGQLSCSPTARFDRIKVKTTAPTRPSYRISVFNGRPSEWAFSGKPTVRRAEIRVPRRPLCAPQTFRCITIIARPQHNVGHASRRNPHVFIVSDRFFFPRFCSYSVRLPVEHDHHRARGRGGRRLGQNEVHLRPGHRSAVHGQVVQGPAGVLQVRAEGAAAHQGVPVARNQRGREYTKIRRYWRSCVIIKRGGGVLQTFFFFFVRSLCPL